MGRSRGQPTRGRSPPGCLPTLIRHLQPAARAAQTAARTASRKHTPANHMPSLVQSTVADSSLIGEYFCVQTGGTAPPASAVPPSRSPLKPIMRCQPGEKGGDKSARERHWPPCPARAPEHPREPARQSRGQACFRPSSTSDTACGNVVRETAGARRRSEQHRRFALRPRSHIAA